MQVDFVDFRLPRSYMVQLPGFHPPLKFIHQTVQVIEGIDDEQQRLVVVDLEPLVDRPFELNGIPRYFLGADRMLDFAIRAEQSAAINAEPMFRSHQPEFHGEPEEARHGFDDAGQPVHLLGFIVNPGYEFRCRVCTFAESHQSFRKRTVGMHGHVTGDTRRTLIELDFEETGGNTIVRFTHSGLLNEEDIRSHEYGWNRAFDNLERTLQST